MKYPMCTYIISLLERLCKNAQSTGRSCHGEKIASTLYLLVYKKIIIKKLE